MDDVEKAIDRLEQNINRNQHETRENLDKLFIYLARLEVAVGKLTIQLEASESDNKQIKEEVRTLRGRVRRIEVLFMPVTLALGGLMAYFINLLKRFGF